MSRETDFKFILFPGHPLLYFYFYARDSMPAVTVPRLRASLNRCSSSGHSPLSRAG
jgi:hypothetical protein